MYLLMAISFIIVGICLFAFANKMTGNSKMVIGAKIISIALIGFAIAMSCLLLTGKVVLPLSKD